MSLSVDSKQEGLARQRAPIVRRLGRTDFESTWRAMQTFTSARTAHTADEFWITEHPPTYTLGLASRREHLPRDTNAIAIVQTDRGGQITYHGPGQLVVYTLLDLRRLKLTVRSLVQTLEAAVIDSLHEDGIAAEANPQRPGVYVNGAKIAALGLKIRAGGSYHGLSLNIDMDLKPFDNIDPCGYPGLRVTSVQELGSMTSIDTYAERVVRHLGSRIHL